MIGCCVQYDGMQGFEIYQISGKNDAMDPVDAFVDDATVNV